MSVIGKARTAKIGTTTARAKRSSGVKRHMTEFALALTLLGVSAPPALAGLRPVETRVASSLRLADRSGSVVDLQSLKGQVVLVNFWATYCRPCREEMPSMEKLKARMKGKAFSVLAVDVEEDEADVSRFLKQVPVTFPILFDRDGATMDAWKGFALPTTYLIDKQGRARYVAVGGLDWNGDAAVKLVEQLLRE